MTTKETNKMSMDGLKSLKKSVRQEFRKKALLGQHVIINRDGKACRIPAEEALKIAEGGK
jgi:hypothetical protein